MKLEEMDRTCRKIADASTEEENFCMDKLLWRRKRTAEMNSKF